MENEDLRASHPDGGAGSTPGKLPYVRPLLRVYGEVSAMTQNNPGTNTGDTKSMMTSTPSEPCLKENIVRIGTHSLGIGLYLFDYKPEFRQRFGGRRQLGLMADEVQRVMPEAVVLHPDGYRTVAYGALGVRPHH
jgi:hypothetical protein